MAETMPRDANETITREQSRSIEQNRAQENESKSVDNTVNSNVSTKKEKKVKKEKTLLTTRPTEDHVKRIKKKCPDKMIIYLEKLKGSKIEEPDVKVLTLEQTATIGKLLIVLRKKIKLTPEQAIFVYINNIQNEKEDLIQDFVNVITSFCARIYGQRRCKRKTEQFIKELENDPVK